MEVIIGIAILIGALWLLFTALGFVIAHWQTFLLVAVVIGLLPFFIE